MHVGESAAAGHLRKHEKSLSKLAATTGPPAPLATEVNTLKQQHSNNNNSFALLRALPVNARGGRGFSSATKAALGGESSHSRSIHTRAHKASPLGESL